MSLSTAGAAASARLDPPDLSVAGRRVAAPAAAAAGADQALTVFGVLWAFAALFHQAAYPDRAFGFSALLVTLPAIGLLMRPSSTWRLGLLAGLQLVQVGWRGLASTSNHWIITTGVNLAIVFAVARLLMLHRGRVDRGELFADFAPAARIALGVLYFYAVFHKLNADFLDPAVSCATTQYADLAAVYPALPTGAAVEYVVIYGTLVVEALIPILLFVRRTRVVAILGASAFHFILALNPDHTFFDFTSMLFALYFLFVPFDYLGAIRGEVARSGVASRLRQRTNARLLMRLGRAALWALAGGLIAAYLLRLTPTDRAMLNALTEAVRLAFVAYGLVVLALFAAVVARHDVVRGARGLDALRPRHPLVLVPAALLVLNGLTPYLGLKTESSFAMFSNLRTEGTRPNHLVLPAAIRVAGYQDDLVRVVASSNGSLRSLARGGLLLPFAEFRIRAARFPNASVTYERGGQVVTAARIADARDLTPATWTDRMFLRFRPVDPAHRGQRCRH